MSWAEHMAAEVAPTSKYGVKRWAEAFGAVADEVGRDGIVSIAIALDEPSLCWRYSVTEVE